MAKRSGKSGISKSARPVTPRRQADANQAAAQKAKGNRYEGPTG